IRDWSLPKPPRHQTNFLLNLTTMMTFSSQRAVLPLLLVLHLQLRVLLLLWTLLMMIWTCSRRLEAICFSIVASSAVDNPLEVSQSHAQPVMNCSTCNASNRAVLPRHWAKPKNLFAPTATRLLSSLPDHARIEDPTNFSRI